MGPFFQRVRKNLISLKFFLKINTRAENALGGKRPGDEANYQIF